MLTFENNHVFTGYLKQLLASFELPKIPVYRATKETVKYKAGNDAITGVLYLKDNAIQLYNGSTYIEKATYNYGEKITNLTHHLVIQNNIYDDYTHRWLGNYLRFQRDYLNLDLMSLYNCFGNQLCTNLSLTHFSTADDTVKIYMIPVKFFQEYTIAIDSHTPVELCCGFYGKTYRADISELQEEIQAATYTKINSCRFNQPFLFDKLIKKSLKESSVMSRLMREEQDLVLFLKLSAANTSTITILEGDYRMFNNSTNHAILNNEYTAVYSTFKTISRLELLQFNQQESFPFADRLIEYLIGNAITREEELSDNIKRLQKMLELNGTSTKYPGLWEEKMRCIVYEYLSDPARQIFKEKYHDLLGYIDKDSEQLYMANDNGKTVSLASIDIYEEEG